MSEKVYLSGKMGGRAVEDVLQERDIAKGHCRRFGLAYYDPAESEGLEERRHATIDMGLDAGTMNWYVRKDEEALDECSVCLVLTGDTPSDGTWWEMARAYYVLKIPIVMVGPKRLREEVMGFSNFKATALFETIEAAVVFIKHGLNKESK